VAQRNPKTYDGKYDPVEQEERIRGIEKIFTVLELREEKRVKIGRFYLTLKADIKSNNVKDRLSGQAFT